MVTPLDMYSFAFLPEPQKVLRRLREGFSCQKRRERHEVAHAEIPNLGEEEPTRRGLAVRQRRAPADVAEGESARDGQLAYMMTTSSPRSGPRCC